MDPAFYNAANAIQVSPTTGNPIAGSGDSLNGTVLWGDGFTADAKNHVPIAASGQYDNLFHDLPRGYITPNWSAPDSTYTDATFGKVTSKTGQRTMPASIRCSF